MFVLKGLNLFSKLSLLSSVRPLLFPLSRHLWMQTCGQKRQRTHAQCKTARRISVQFSVCDKTALCVVSMMYLIAAVKENNKFDICFVLHDSVPTLKVVLVARETINEEAEFFLVFLHGVFHGLSKQKQQQKPQRLYLNL